MFCLADLSQATDRSYAEDGIETGFFLQIYRAALEDRSQSLAQRVAEEERHLGRINLRAAEHLDVQGHFRDSAGAI